METKTFIVFRDPETKTGFRKCLVVRSYPDNAYYGVDINKKPFSVPAGIVVEKSRLQSTINKIRSEKDHDKKRAH